MLVLTRKNLESVVVGGTVGCEKLLKVTVLEIAGGKVRLGFEIDHGSSVNRWEAWLRNRTAGPCRNRAAAIAPMNGL